MVLGLSLFDLDSLQPGIDVGELISATGNHALGLSDHSMALLDPIGESDGLTFACWVLLQELNKEGFTCMSLLNLLLQVSNLALAGADGAVSLEKLLLEKVTLSGELGQRESVHVDE